MGTTWWHSRNMSGNTNREGSRLVEAPSVSSFFSCCCFCFSYHFPFGFSCLLLILLSSLLLSLLRIFLSLLLFLGVLLPPKILLLLSLFLLPFLIASIILVSAVSSTDVFLSLLLFLSVFFLYLSAVSIVHLFSPTFPCNESLVISPAAEPINILLCPTFQHRTLFVLPNPIKIKD